MVFFMEAGKQNSYVVFAYRAITFHNHHVQ